MVADHFDPPKDPHHNDPDGWVRSNGGFLWSKQRDIGQSVVENRYTAVHSSHGTGKSFGASRFAGWFLKTHSDPFVVTTAPTTPQISAILWREMHAMHEDYDLPGRTTLDNEWYFGKRLVAFGRKPADYTDPEKAKAAFQGIHAKNILIILDEAAGIPKWLWDAVDSLMTNRGARALAIGNPDDPASEFARVCAPGSLWNTIHISAFDTPAFTGEPVPADLLEQLVSPEWVEERKKKWGEDSPMYVSKVLGLFPDLSDDTLITPSMIREACGRDLPGFELGQFGADIARGGDDLTAVYRNRGGVIRKEKTWGKTNTMKTAGRLKRYLEKTHRAVPMIIDIIGIGAGVYDRLREQGLPVYGFNSSKRAEERASDTEDYRNIRSQRWWDFRKMFEESEVDLDPLDIDLHAQLMSIKWWADSSGRIVVEPKEMTKKRIGVSPDLADACMYSTVKVDQWRVFVEEFDDGHDTDGRTLTGDLLEAPM
jgi:hypothetical protein